jgi:hypothetical protein
VTLYGELGSNLAWSSPCPAAYLKLSASLCWQHQRNTSHCTPIFNSTLEDIVEKRDLVRVGDYYDDDDEEEDNNDEYSLPSPVDRNIMFLLWINTLRCVCR